MNRIDPDQIDELLHNPIRLALVTALSQVEYGDFQWLKEVANTTDGNLATHLRKLEDAGYILVEKTFKGRKPASYYRLSDVGALKFKHYIRVLSDFIHALDADNAAGQDGKV
jgi:DNA-binding transcriptional ArsR family regulator